jgi:GNAT superfamily N-acetyltransferase
MPDAATPPANVDDLVFRSMEPTDRDLRLFHDCFAANGSPRPLEMLRWQYLDAPAGPLLVDLALTPGPDARLAAIYAVFPVSMRADGRRVLGVQSLNTLTDEAYRGKGLFLRMANALYSRCAREGVELVYGFPNGNSAHGFFKRLDWNSLDPMPFMLRPLRSGYVLRKLGAGALANVLDMPLTFGRAPRLRDGHELRTLSSVGPEFDAVWNAFAEPIRFAVERDAAYWSWRLRRPGENYECIGLFDRGRAVGLAVIGVTRAEDGQTVGKLMELMFDPACDEAGNALADEALRRLKAKGCVVAWAWNFEHSPNRPALRHAGFFGIPSSRHPAELHAGARAFTALSALGERDKWYISMLDSDTA